MGKLIKIEDCMECPFFVNPEFKGYCVKLKRVIEMINCEYVIPDECPLDNCNIPD